MVELVVFFKVVLFKVVGRKVRFKFIIIVCFVIVFEIVFVVVFEIVID